MGQLKYIGAFGLLLTASSLAVSAKKAPEMVLDWSAGREILVCSSSGGKCIQLEMPRSVGEVKKVIVQKFVPGSRLSWLAIGKESVNLCTVDSAMPTVSCARISHEFDNMSVNVGQTIYGNDLRWVFRGQGKSDSREKVIKDFMDSYGRARAYLYKKSVAPTGDMEMHATLVDAGGGGAGCYVDEDGGGYCDGGSSSGSGGDGGDGGQIVFVPPPPPPPIVDPNDPTIPKVIVTPEVPTLPPGPTEPWYCTWFGVNFCSPPAEPAPPSNPPPSVPTPPPTSPVVPRYAEGYEEEMAQCFTHYENDLDECSAYYTVYGHQTWLTCKANAATNLKNCQSDARDKFRIP